MNLLFILLNLPIQIELLIPNFDLDNIYLSVTYIFYISYIVNFYIILFTNSLFRREFLFLIFKTKIQLTSFTRTQGIDHVETTI